MTPTQLKQLLTEIPSSTQPTITSALDSINVDDLLTYLQNHNQFKSYNDLLKENTQLLQLLKSYQQLHQQFTDYLSSMIEVSNLDLQTLQSIQTKFITLLKGCETHE